MTDEQAIKQTVTEYFESWFEGDAPRMERALHPRLAKRRSTGDGKLDEDTTQTMIDATRAGYGARHPPEKRGIDVEVKEIYGSIASVVVHSEVYREYLHLARTDDGWKIVNALWDFA
jgi:ketosteroid isomerase-like protein